MRWTSKSIADLPVIAKEILDHYTDKKVFALYGEMGVGKTTLTKAIISALGAVDEGHSPTYSLVNEYKGTYGPIYHFDMYRLNSEEEAYDYGVEEYFANESAYIIIEWPEKTPNLLPNNCVELMITVNVEARIIEEL